MANEVPTYFMIIVGILLTILTILVIFVAAWAIVYIIRDIKDWIEDFLDDHDVFRR